MGNPEETFKIECNDLLADMEEALLFLESNPNDTTQLNAIFRAMHTIKGTSGVFGYEDIIDFTHIAESVLDKVRSNDIAISADLTALLLESVDQTKVLVEASIIGRELNAQEKIKENKLIDRFNAFLGHEVKVVDQDRQELVVDESINQESMINVNANCWHISVKFEKEIFECGMDPISIFTYLKKMGKILQITTFYNSLPLDGSFIPESNYLGFEIDFESDTDKEKIEMAFEFVKEMCVLYILPPKSNVNEYTDRINALPKEDMRLGEILVAGGAISQKELKSALKNQNASVSRSQKAKPLGDVLVENKAVYREVVDAALDKQTEVKNVSKSQRVLRVDAEKLDSLINLVGELVIAGATTNMIATHLGDERLLESMSGLSRLVEDIRDNALDLRMVQVGETFNRFKRVVRDVSRDLGKNINLTINGADTELDKTVVEKIADPLMHLVRNSMDHGIELAEERVKNGKPEQGNLTLNAYHDAGSIVIEVIDDGKGLDRDKILAKAIEKNIVSETQMISDEEIYRLIFEAGFSTAEQVTSISGRGVGMDVVKKNIEALRGTVDVESKVGEGSKISIRLPLTLAIIDGFLVKVGDSSYVIPLDMVHECIDLSDDEHEDYEEYEGNELGYINLRDEALPFLNLHDYFKEETPEATRKSIVVVRYGNRKAGFVVDELLGELQTVIKPMGKVLKNLKGISGATILGSGEVAVILDVPNLIHRATRITYIDPSVGSNSSQPTVH